MSSVLLMSSLKNVYIIMLNIHIMDFTDIINSSNIFLFFKLFMPLINVTSDFS